MSSKKVFVTGCFDMLHSGHVAFLKEAAAFGELYVCIGSDRTIQQLKGRPTINSQEERKYMIESLNCVHECRVNSGSGIIDFENELQDIKPDIFVVNEDGHTHQKEKLCNETGIEYKVFQRKPYSDLPARSTTALRTVSNIPFRIDLAGGWLDQPFVSKFYPGPVLTISIEPTVEFNNRSGMASSTRNKAIELWRSGIPEGDREQLAKLLFSYENPPGTKEVAGSQDSLGIVMPGLNRHYYNGGYWPEQIKSNHEEDILSWLESKLYLVTLGPRAIDYVVIENTNITEEGARDLSTAAENCWQAILKKDVISLGKSFSDSFYAQIAMFPNMADEYIYGLIDQYKNKILGFKLSGAGGGGYLILVSDEPVKDAMQIKIRRKDWI
jgi:cytidyltransferase-like protein